jgi:phage-related protein (TIGR01555 family)
MAQPRVSVRAQVRSALSQERALAAPPGKRKAVSAATRDSFVNFMQGIGVMAGSNGLAGATYGFNPITRNRILCEWIHRGSWLGGVAVDVIGDDMTRKGVEVESEMDTADVQKIESEAQRLAVWDKLNGGIKWGRLYGGAVCVALVDGQDFRTPLRPETVGKGQFKGLVALDRWMLTPELGDLVTELGPYLGMPKYYRVLDNAPALRGEVIHYSRIVLRHLGVELPYQQALTENLWGISVYERFYDRMVGFDTASMGAAQLVTKSYLRTLKVEGLRELVAAGGEMLLGLQSYVQQMRQFQGLEGITVIDATDDFAVQQTSAFSGVDAVITQLAQQVSGALGVPLVRLLGQSPAGLSATGESDWRNYYDGIGARQNKDLGQGVPLLYRLIAQSVGVRPPEDFTTKFRPLYELTEEQKAKVASDTVAAVQAAKDAGLVGTQTGMKELKQSSRRTGVFTNISEEAIEAADDEIAPPMSEQLLDAAQFGQGAGKPGYRAPGAKEDDDADAGQDGQEAKVDARPRRRVSV